MDRMGHFRAHGLQHRRAASALLVGWCLSGCWYPWINYPHQYYGPGTLPPTMNGPIVPGGTYVPGTPNPLSPSSPGTTTPSNPAPTPNWRPENGTKTDAPPFRPNTGNQGVPFPNDDFGGTPPGASRPPGNRSSAVPRPNNSAVNTVALTPEVTSDSEQPPQPLNPPLNPLPAAGDNTTPYAYDANGYSWLKGIVDFDPSTKTWALIYSLNPDANDRFGGMFYLSGSDLLVELKTGDLVMVHGQPDPLLKDDRGLPRYRVQRYTRLGTPAQ